MLRTYRSPSIVEYGSIANLTGVFGGPASGDVIVDVNGVVENSDQLSIDACAEDNDKCKCEDNGTC